MNVQLLQAQVERRRPILHEVLAQHGDEPVSTYAAGFWAQAANAGPDIRARRGQLSDLVAGLAGQIYGPAVADIVRSHWVNIPLMTGDHHGPTFYPGLLSGDILFALDAVLNGDDKPVVVLACGNVPLSNATGPRGIYLPPWLDPPTTTYSLFPPALLDSSVYAAPPYTEDRLQRVLQRVRGKLHHHRLSRKAVTRTMQTLEQALTAALDESTYARQVSIINARLWPFLFEPELRPALPPLVYLQLEEVSGRALLDYPGFLAQVLYDSAIRGEAVELFEGIPGCWDGAGGGTHFFWGIAEDGRTYPLRLDGDYLRGNGAAFRLHPAEIGEAIAQRKIIPGLMLCFGVLVFVHGCSVYGGFMQVDYLSRMKAAWIDLLQRHNATEEAEWVAHIETRNYSTGPIVAYARHHNLLYPAGGLDLLLSGGLQRHFLEQIAGLSVTQLNQAGLVEMLQIILTPDEWPPELRGITNGMILHELGLQYRLLIDIGG